MGLHHLLFAKQSLHRTFCPNTCGFYTLVLGKLTDKLIFSNVDDQTLASPQLHMMATLINKTGIINLNSIDSCFRNHVSQNITDMLAAIVRKAIERI